MKFQKHLEWHRVPDWRDAYFNYKQLKKDLKKVKDNDQSFSRSKIDVDTFDRIQQLGTLVGNASNFPGQSPRLRSLFGSPSFAEESWIDNGNGFVVVHKKSLRTYSEDDVIYETELLGPFSDAEYVRLFFTKLDSQLNMINNFYKQKEMEYISYSQQLQNQLEILFEQGDYSEDIERNAVKSNVRRALKLLRNGFMEFYRSLGHLKNYILLNRMAFGKILKKHDKVTGKSASETYLRAVYMSYFSTSDKILQMMEQVKSIFTDYFLKGNREKALACLQPMCKQAYNINFVLGLSTGCSCSLLITCILLLVLPQHDKLPKIDTAFPIFSTIVLFVLHLYFYACNIYFWRRARINYTYIFEFEPRAELKYKDVLLLSTTLTMLLMGAMIVYLVLYAIPSVSDVVREMVPLGTFVMLAGLLLLPLDVFYKSARSIFFHSLLRIMFAPLFKVVLADFFLADQLTSQVVALKNLGFTLCYYSGGYFQRQDGVSCASKLPLQYALVVLPYWWRLMQCLRRWVDLKDPVQLANAGKYLIALVAIVMKITYKWSESATWKGLFIVSSISATAYQLYWDFIMDWGLLKRGSSNRWLREKLMVEHKFVYYLSMVANTLLRLLWLFALFHLELGAVKSLSVEFLLAGLEVCRRGLWNFYRLENEHLNNVGKYRVLKVVPLPFEDEDYAEVLCSGSSVAPVAMDARKRSM